MNGEFIQGAYNKYEHNHAEWSDEKLQDKLNELSANLRSIRYIEPRLSQVQHEMGLIAFEMSERLRESRDEEIEEAWKEYEDGNVET